MHQQVEANRWVKIEPVDAYQIGAGVSVSTRIGDHEETVATSDAGDWIVRQPGGELIIVRDADFHLRYRPTAPGPDGDGD